MERLDPSPLPRDEPDRDGPREPLMSIPSSPPSAPEPQPASEPPDEFAKQLTDYMMAQDPPINQTQLAAQLGVTPGALSKWVLGQRKCKSQATILRTLGLGPPKVFAEQLTDHMAAVQDPPMKPRGAAMKPRGARSYRSSYCKVANCEKEAAWHLLTPELCYKKTLCSDCGRKRQLGSGDACSRATWQAAERRCGIDTADRSTWARDDPRRTEIWQAALPLARLSAQREAGRWNKASAAPPKADPGLPLATTAAPLPRGGARSARAVSAPGGPVTSPAKVEEDDSSACFDERPEPSWDSSSSDQGADAVPASPWGWLSVDSEIHDSWDWSSSDEGADGWRSTDSENQDSSPLCNEDLLTNSWTWASRDCVTGDSKITGDSKNDSPSSGDIQTDFFSHSGDFNSEALTTSSPESVATCSITPDDERASTASLLDSAVAQAVINGADPSRPLEIADVLALLRHPCWAGGPPPKRPPQLPEDPADRALLFREPRSLGRGTNGGALDQWETFERSREKILQIPEAMQLTNGQNVAVLRQGRVIRTGSRQQQLQFRQWSLGTSTRDGAVLEPPNGSDNPTLYQVFCVPTDPKQQQQSQQRHHQNQNHKRRQKQKQKREQREQQQQHQHQKQQHCLSDPFAPAHIDFHPLDMCPGDRKTLKESLLGKAPPKRQRLIPLSLHTQVLAVVGCLTVLGLIVFHAAGRGNSSDSTTDTLPSGITCSLTAEGLAHGLPSSIEGCKRVSPTQNVACSFKCMPGYFPSGRLTCGVGVGPLDGGGASCLACSPGKFSDGKDECETCALCPQGYMTVSSCTLSNNTRCMRWAQHLNLGAATNSSHSWHLPQFTSVLRPLATRGLVAFGGISPPKTYRTFDDVKPSLPPTSFCPIQGARTSSELWMARCSGLYLYGCQDWEEWRLFGGYTTRVHLVAHTSLGQQGWPSARSSAVSLSVPTHVQPHPLIPNTTVRATTFAIMFSGAFPPPCLTSNLGPTDIEFLMNPSDMWSFAFRDDSSGTPVPAWSRFGGHQSWRKHSVTSFQSTMSAGCETADSIASPNEAVKWPLGRHDSHMWLVRGMLLLFSGATDIFMRNAVDCTELNKQLCMVKSTYLLCDWWTMDMRKFKWIGIASQSNNTHQPGPRAYGATWTSDPDLPTATPWIFGGIGLVVSSGGAVAGSAVVASTDTPLQTLCDLWRFDANTERPWQLIGSCSGNAIELARHGLAPRGVSPHDIMQGSASVYDSPLTDMMLSAAVLAATWTDSHHDLWLYGGARCGSSGEVGVVDATDCAATLAEEGRQRLSSKLHSPSDASKRSSDPQLELRVGQGTVACSSDLWRFDIHRLRWSSYMHAELVSDSSTGNLAGSWPKAACGATTVPAVDMKLQHEANDYFGVMVGGWSGSAFTGCDDDGVEDGTLRGESSAVHDAVCSNGAWFVEEMSDDDAPGAPQGPGLPAGRGKGGWGGGRGGRGGDMANGQG